MIHRHSPLLFAALAVAACSPSAPTAVAPTAAAPTASAAAASSASAAPRQLSADTPDKTALGATFTIPSGWFVSRPDGAILLQDPERELKLWLVDVDGKPLGEAIAAAWKAVRPDFALQVEDRAKPPARGGWDEVQQNKYVTSTAGTRVVIANARRKGHKVFVVLIDATTKALSRRGAQLGQIFGGLKAPGQHEESFAGKPPKPLDGQALAKLDAFIEAALVQSGVPGAAVAVVQGGKIVFERGYGLRQKGKAAKVSANTAFMIGSTTKSMTSLMMAKLVEEGLFAWSTPVTKLMPTFKLGDPEATKKITMRHTLCACTGLPRQDMEFLFEYAKATPKQRFAELATMKPTTGFGETFQYSNALVSAAGYVAARAAYPHASLEAAYAKAMKTRVLEPIGMKRTTFDMAAAQRGEHAMPHGLTMDGSYVSMPLSVEQAVVSIAPAGGAWSTVGDLARYMMVELAQGKNASGKQLYRPATILERRKPGVKIADKKYYGLALVSGEANGVHAVGHGGATLGFSCSWELYPELGTGMVILSNAQGAGLINRALRRYLFELLFDGKPEAKESLGYAVKRRQELLAEERAKIVEGDPKWWSPLVKRYRNPALGTLALSAAGGHHLLDAGEWKSEVVHERGKDGASTLMLIDPPLAGLELVPAKGKLLLRAAQQEYVFKPL